MKHSILGIVLILSLFSCKPETNNVKTNADTPAAPAIAQSAPQPSSGTSTQAPYQSVTSDIMKDLYENCQLIDYIFHKLPFSMNQSEKSGIQSTITHVSPVAQEYITPGCEPIARQFFQVKGDITLEADIYFSDNCKFFVFFKDGKAFAANKMSPSGIEFYGNIIKQALNARKSAVSGQ